MFGDHIGQQQAAGMDEAIRGAEAVFDAAKRFFQRDSPDFQLIGNAAEERLLLFPRSGGDIAGIYRCLSGKGTCLVFAYSHPLVRDFQSRAGESPRLCQPLRRKPQNELGAARQMQ